MSMKQIEVQIDYKLLIITSRAFSPNGDIPKKYTCEGENSNPPLDISGTPDEAKSLVLIVDDPDAPGKTFVHWVVWNIPITHHINEDEVPGDQGLNDFGEVSYGGPCPPSGKHRYYFKVYALDDLLDLEAGSTREQVEQAMAGHIIGFGELMGHYKRMNR
jgi:Raf kinase inhibitor-like YbhB/YbcL family protein